MCGQTPIRLDVHPVMSDKLFQLGKLPVQRGVNRAVAVLTRELLYTGVTRAKTRLTLIAPQPDVLWRAVESRVIRSGGLD